MPMPAEWIMLSILLAAGTVATDAETAPSLEMLEFLGNWETAQGAAIDPAQLADTASATEKPSEGKLHE